MKVRTLLIGLTLGVVLAVAAPLGRADSSAQTAWFRAEHGLSPVGVIVTRLAGAGNSAQAVWFRAEHGLSPVGVSGTRLAGAGNSAQAVWFRAEHGLPLRSPVPATAGRGGFDWGDFGIGAASTLGALLLLGGIAGGMLAVRHHRSGSLRSA